jgi:CBS domain-containing protein
VTALLGEKISTLNLPSPVVVESGTPIGSVVEQIQRARTGCVLIYGGNKLVGIMTERDVLLKVVARDVKYDEAVDGFMTRDPVTLTLSDTIGDAINVMNEGNFRHIPIVKSTGEATAIFSIRQVIDYLAESFPTTVINLPPRPHQKMLTRDGA